jgi:1-acyl-sn-glycerol-3-phosphate acyltransferase
MPGPPLYNALVLTGFRWWFRKLYRVELRDAWRIPAAGPVIVVSNHESMLDPFLLGLATLRPIRYMAKSELWRSRALGKLMDGLGTFPVERGTGDHGAVGIAARLLEDGEVLGVFPQGTCLPYRHRPWHRGAARLALTTGTPIVPVCIVGSERALRPGKFKVGFPRVHVLVCEPIVVEPGRPTIAAAKELTGQLEAAIEEARLPFGPPAHAWYPEERLA